MGAEPSRSDAPRLPPPGAGSNRSTTFAVYRAAGGSMDIVLFKYQGRQEIRLVKVDDKGVPWFVARDVCNVLGIQQTDTVLRNLPAKNKGTDTIRTPGG